MNVYKIETGVLSEIYSGKNREHALNKFAKDAGYKNYDDLASQHGEVEEVTEYTNAYQSWNGRSNFWMIHSKSKKGLIGNSPVKLDGIPVNKGKTRNRKTKNAKSSNYKNSSKGSFWDMFGL